MRAVVVAVAATLTGAACAALPPPQPTPLFSEPAAGYLSTIQLAQAVEAVPNAPGLDAEATDRAAPDRLRAFEDSPRWLLATAHAEVRPPLGFEHFDCALGAVMSQASDAATRPLARVFADATAAAALSREAAPHRARPIAVDPDRRACRRLSPDARSSSGRPAVAAVVAAAQAEILAELAPDASGAVRETARQIGLSQAVCGLAYPSDVEAGLALGRAVGRAALAADGFQAESPPARAALAALRAEGGRSPGCAAERAAFAQTPAA